MCIAKVESYQYAGKLYTTELDAVKAALSEIGSRIIKEHAGNPIDGLLKYGADITPLRNRYIDLTAPEVTSEKAVPPFIGKAHRPGCAALPAGEAECNCGGNPNYTPDPFTEIRDALDPEKRKLDPGTHAQAAALITRYGNGFLSDFLEQAPSKQIHKLQVILGLRGDDDE